MIAISGNATPVSFEWEFDRKAFDNAQHSTIEDDIYGWMLVTTGDEHYVVDIHREYLNSREKGYDLEVFRRASYGGHGEWCGSVRGIHSVTAKHDPLGHFKRRAEKLITAFLACPENC